MCDYPSLKLQSHTVLQSTGDSFVQPDIHLNWFGSRLHKARQFLLDSSFLNARSLALPDNGPIVCAAWHPSQTNQVAFGMSDGVVQVVVQPSSKLISLRNQHQRGVVCLAWQPNSTKTLSVGCSTGILVWEVISQRTSSLPSRTTFHATSGAVTSLSYTADGRQCLATASTELLIYDCIYGDRVMCIKRISTPSFVLTSSEFGFTFLADGLKFHILRGITESTESFTRLKTPVKCAVWSPTASHLLFAMGESSLVLFLEIYSPREMNSKMSPQTDVLIDLQQTASYNEGEEWHVETITLDDSAQRLAVLAKYKTCSKVFIFGLCLKSNTVHELDAVSQSTNLTTNILYQHKSKQGALLCVCSEDGSVTFLPDNSLQPS